MTNVPKKWAERALYDLETAKAMLESGRFLYVLFCCQQAVEKMLKGLVAQNTLKHPPYIHGLKKLAEKAEIALDSKTKRDLDRISRYYIEPRYPDELEMLEKDVDESYAGEALQITEELLSWLKSHLK